MISGARVAASRRLAGADAAIVSHACGVCFAGTDATASKTCPIPISPVLTSRTESYVIEPSKRTKVSRLRTHLNIPSGRPAGLEAQIRPYARVRLRRGLRRIGRL